MLGCYKLERKMEQETRNELVLFKAMLHADLLEFYMQTYSMSANKIINSEKFP